MKTIMDASAIQRAITRITYEILERNHGADQLAVIGIYSRGVILAERIVERIAELEHRQVELGALDLPIRPDYVGKNLPTAQTETVKVSVNELDDADCVTIF